MQASQISPKLTNEDAYESPAYDGTSWAQMEGILGLCRVCNQVITTSIGSESCPLHQDNKSTILSSSNIDDASRITVSLGPCTLETTLEITGVSQTDNPNRKGDE